MGRSLSIPYAGLSLWHATAGDPWVPRAPLDGDREVDVAIVGAGFTGLWTAYYLAEADPGLRVAVLESEVAGFGASGRNGGWCSALFPASAATLAGLGGREGALAQHAAMRATVDEVVRVAAAEGIDAHVAKGGTITLARSAPQWQRAQQEVAAARTWGRDETDVRLWEAGETTARLRATAVLGATYTSDCAVIHPARLVRGLARAVERRGVDVYEGTRVTSIEPGAAVTDRGTVRARYVLRATEGFTALLPGR
ncbi:MAG: FAD-dependent oxidoreductase, partial [Nocardioides sp.]|nr:FAD-dependent oxidoreductase [Nocardioides sp.]